MSNTKTITVTCPKCFGSRYFEKFGHIVGGACFRCGAAGTIEIDASRLEAPTRRDDSAADRYYSARPYLLAVDGMDTASLVFKTWEDARAYLGDGIQNDDGDEYRIAKWNGERHCYRDGTPVKFRT